MSDADRVLAILQGDTDQFRALMEEHQHRVFGTVYKILQDRGAAEDATQEVFIKAYHALHTFQHQSSLSTWLYRIAINHCYSILRKTKETVSLSPEWDARTDESPEGIALRNETMYMIEQGIRRLAPDARAVLALRLHAELSYDEIGQIVGVSADTAKVRYHRARLQLQAYLTREGLAPSSRREYAK